MGDMRQGSGRHGNRVMGDMRQGNKRHGNRVMEDMRQSNKRHGNRVFKTWYRVIRGSFEIWRINLKAYIMGTRRHGVDGDKRNITEVLTAQRVAEV